MPDLQKGVFETVTLELSLSLLVYPFVALLVYFPCLNGMPVFDDAQVIPNVEPLSWKRLKRIWTGEYRPLTQTLFCLNRSWPNTMRCLHATNVLIHAASGLVVERIAREIGLDVGLSTLAGLLFIVHPFAVNTVGFVTGRASALSAFFGLASAWAILAGFWPLAIPLLMLAFFSKEDGLGFATLDVAIGLYAGAWALVLLLVFGGLAYLIYRRGWFAEFLTRNGDDVMSDIGLPKAHKQPQQGFTVLVETILRLPWWSIGFGTSPYHGSGIKIPGLFRLAFALLVAAFIGIALALFPVPVLLILLGPWLIYLVCPVPDQLIEYRNYASTAGFALLLAAAFSPAPAYLWGTLLASFGVISARYAYNWISPTEMWTAAACHSSGDPSRAYQELGAWWKIQNEIFRAEAALRDAVRVNPRLGPAMNNLAWILHDRARTEADTATDEEKKGNTESAAWHRQRSKTLMEESIQTMEQCVERCPTYASGWEDLGLLYEVPGRFADAESCYVKALALNPTLFRSANRLGLSAFKVKAYSRAAELFDQALTQQPDHFEFRYNRACVWVKFGEVDRARDFMSTVPQPFPITRNMIPPELAQAAS